MGGLGANDRVVGIGERFESQAISGGSVKDKKCFDIIAKVALELAPGGFGVGIISVSDNMTLIGGGYSFQNLGMDTGIVVAGEAAGRPRRSTI